ncbi:MAG: hypothetical protein WCI02_02655 [Planctomycetota bacterium]
MIEVLGDRVKTIEWGDALESKWKDRWKFAVETGNATRSNAFKFTRDLLIEDLPREVMAIQSVACYPDETTLLNDLQLQKVEGVIQPSYSPHIAAVLGRTFLVPSKTLDKPKNIDEEIELLEKVVNLSSNRKFQRRRASYWNWQRSFTEGVITDQRTVDAAVLEMHELLEEEHDAIREQGVETIVRYAFLIATVATGALAGPLSPITLGSAFLTVGQFLWNEQRLKKSVTIEGRQPDEANVAALFHDVRAHFGMR